MARMRLRRGRRRFDTEPPVRVLARGAVVLGLLAIFLWLAGTLYNGVPGRDYRDVEAVVPKLGSLIIHDPVRMGGVRVGQVTTVGAGPEGQGRLVLQLEPGTELKADTGIRIRANGLLGARYVELVPGRSTQPLPAGTALHGDARTLTYGVTDALDVLDVKTRGALKPLVGELGRGLAGQGTNVNDLIRAGSLDIGGTSQLFAQLNADPASVHRLLPAAASAAAAMAPAREPLTRALVEVSPALQPVVTERQAVRDTLDAAPGALTAARDGLGEGRPLLRSAERLAAQVNASLPPAPAALRATAALLRDARDPLEDARPLLGDVKPTVPVLLKTTSALRPVLKPATALLGDLSPILTTISPYGCDVENFGVVFRSMTGLGSSAPGGPAGAPMQFRLQVAAPPPGEALGLADSSGLTKREGVPAPCAHLSTPYPIVDKPTDLKAGRK